MKKIMGNALKNERESKCIALEDIARETNLSVRYLTALENEDVKFLPGDFYVRYYIKSYLQYMGSDEAAFFAKYGGHMQELFASTWPAPAANLLENVQYSKFRRGRLLLVVFLFVVAGLLILIFKPWNLLKWERSAGKVSLDLPRDPFPYALPRAGWDLDTDAVAVSIRLVDRCWIRVERGGEKVVDKIFQKGETLAVRGYFLTVMIGNPPAVDLKVNGRDLQAIKQKSELLKLVLTPSTLPDIFKNF